MMRASTHTTATICTALLIGCVTARPAPPDHVNQKEMMFEKISGSRYTEILLVFGDPVKEDLRIGVYNTLGLNGADPSGPGDSTPQTLLEGIDLDLVKKNHAALKVLKNGPRLWTVDYLSANVGRERNFQGLKARWAAWLTLPKGGKLTTPYSVTKIERKTSMGIWKGSRVYLLDDLDGNTWCMKSMSMMRDPSLRLASLAELGSRLDLPDGWKYRTAVLSEDLIFTTDKGATMVTKDDFGNVYDRVGGPYSNFKP